MECAGSRPRPGARPAEHHRYRHLIKTVILPAFAERDFRSIRRAEVQKLHASMKDRPEAANNVLAVLCSLNGRILGDWEMAEIPSGWTSTPRARRRTAASAPTSGAAAHRR